MIGHEIGILKSLNRFSVHRNYVLLDKIYFSANLRSCIMSQFIVDTFERGFIFAIQVIQCRFEHQFIDKIQLHNSYIFINAWEYVLCKYNTVKLCNFTVRSFDFVNFLMFSIPNASFEYLRFVNDHSRLFWMKRSH